MSNEQASLLARRAILAAYVAALHDVRGLLAVCASTSGDQDALRDAVGDAFRLSPMAADAVLQLEAMRVTPGQLQIIRQELVEVERRTTGLKISTRV